MEQPQRLPLRPPFPHERPPAGELHHRPRQLRGNERGDEKPGPAGLSRLSQKAGERLAGLPREGGGGHRHRPHRGPPLRPVRHGAVFYDGLHGHGGGGEADPPVRARGRGRPAGGGLHRLGRGAHAGGDPLPDADGQGQRRGGAAQRRGPVLPHGAHRPDHRRRDRQLRHGGGHHHGRTWGHGGLRGAKGHRADHQQEAARGLPAGGIPAGARVCGLHRSPQGAAAGHRRAARAARKGPRA